MIKNILILAAIPIIFYGCAKEDSANVNQDSIYSIYELSYNEADDITTAQATYRFGGATGTLLELNDPASVTFDGDALTYNAILGVHNKEYAGMVASGMYSYKDLDGLTFNNTVGTIDTIGFLAVDTIDATSAYTFGWTGNSVGENETITVTVDGTAQENFEVFTTIQQGNTDMTLASDKLQKVGEGMATVYLRRAYNKFTVDEGTSTGGRVAVWYDTQKQIYIKQ